MSGLAKPELGTASKEHLRLWLRILKVNRLIEAELRERLRVNFDTTLPRFDVMSALYRKGSGLKMSALSRMLMVSNGNVTGIVERLMQDGLVLREAVPGDRRAAQVTLTGKGITEFRRQAAAHEAWVSELLGGLDAADSALAARYLGTALTIDKTEENDAKNP
ncbi:MAG: MarR family transcriptional regulator [Pseudomonadota bacterium]